MTRKLGIAEVRRWVCQRDRFLCDIFEAARQNAAIMDGLLEDVAEGIEQYQRSGGLSGRTYRCPRCGMTSKQWTRQVEEDRDMTAWLRRNRDQYRGCWVALQRRRLVATASSYKKVLEVLRRSRIGRALIYRVPR